MKICFISDSYKPIVDGVVRYFDYVIPALLKEGHEVTLVCPWFVGTDHYEYPFDGFEVVRCTTTHIKSEDYWSSFPDWRLVKAIKQADFVFIHSFMYLGGFGGLIAKALRKKVGFFIHQDERLVLRHILGVPQVLTNFLVTFLSKLYYPLVVDAFFHATERFKGKLLDLGVPEGKIFHTPFAINTERFHPGAPEYDIRKRHGIPADATVAVYVGRLAIEKNIANLLEGLDRAMAEHPNLYALIVGGGAHSDYYTSLPRKHRDRFIFTGYIPEEELQSHYVAADFFASPSINESSCFTVFEAMICQLPVITSEYRHDPDIVHKENALLVKDLLNPNEIKDSILLLASDASLREKLGKNGRKLVKSRTWEQHAKAFLRGVKATFVSESSKRSLKSIAESFRAFRASRASREVKSKSKDAS